VIRCYIDSVLLDTIDVTSVMHMTMTIAISSKGELPLDCFMGDSALSTQNISFDLRKARP